MMNPIRPLFRLFSVIEHEVSGRDWALGMAMGTWLGWVFGLNLQTLIGFMAITLIRGNLVGIVGAFAIALGVRDFMIEPAHQIGYWVLTHGASYRRLWAGIYHAPLIPFTFFYVASVMGRMVLGLISSVAVFFGVMAVVQPYRGKIFLKIMDGPLGYAWQHSPFRHAYLVFVSRYGTPVISETLFRTRAPIYVSGLFVLGCLGFYTAIPYLLEGALSRYLSIVNGAPVNVGTVSLSLTRGELELTDVAVTHHVQPSKNLLVIDNLRAKFEVLPLLSKKIIIRKVAINGVQLDVEKRTLDEVSMTEIADAPVPSLMDRVAVHFFNEARNEVRESPFRYIVALQKGVDIATVLHQEKRSLVSERELAAILAETEAMRGRCQAEATSTFGPKCQAEWETLNKRYRSVEKIVENDVTRLKTQLGFTPVNATDLSKVLLGPRILQWMERFGYWVDFSRRRMGVAQDPRPYTMVEERGPQGVLIHFGKRSTVPSLLIEEITISSKAVPKTTYGNVKGSLRGLTNAPAVYGRPIEGEIEFDFPNNGYKKTTATLYVDHTAEVNEEKITLKSEEMPLNAWAFYQGAELYLGLQKAQATFDMSLAVKDECLNTVGTMTLRPIQYEIRSPYKQLEMQLRTVFTTQNNIPLTFEISGLPSQGRLSLQSPFGIKIANSLREEFRQTQAAVEENLRREIEDNLAAPRRTVDSRLGENYSSFTDSFRKTASSK